MGCLKLTYRSETPTLKVVRNTLKESEKPCAGAYRFGFNGHEKDDEVFGVTGAFLSWGNYGYDSRLGRRWQIDPQWQKLPGQSPYSANNNNPIQYTDPDGEFGLIGAAIGAVAGAVVGVVKAAIEGEDFTNSKTWAKIGAATLTGAAIGALPVSAGGIIAAGGIGFTSDIVDQGIDKGYDGENVLDLKSYNYKKAATQGVVTSLTFGVGGGATKLLRNGAIMRNWTGPLDRSPLTKLFYDNPAIGGALLNGGYDVTKTVLNKTASELGDALNKNVIAGTVPSEDIDSEGNIKDEGVFTPIDNTLPEVEIKSK